MAGGATITALEAPPPPSTACGEEDLLLAAMIETGAAEGYAGASVARVLARASLSRRAFYRHFASREDCFLAAYRSAAAIFGARLAATVRASPPAERPRALLAATLRAVDEHPAAARIVFLEALAASPDIRAEHERLLGGVESSIERFIASPGAPTLRVPPIALLGGVYAIISAYLLERVEGTAADLTADLRGWVHSYECAAATDPAPPWPDAGWVGMHTSSATRTQAGDVRLLPRGASALAPPLAAAARRARILAATMRQTACRGYARLTVADIVADARIPRAAFYTHFSGKEDAFLAAQTLALRESIAAAAAEFATGDTWPERVWRGLAALLAYIVANPDAASLGFVELHAAGEAARARDRENRGAYTLFLADGYHQRPQAARLPRLCSDAVAGGIEAILRRYVVGGQVDRVDEALPQCAYVALAPFIGPEVALSWVTNRIQAADR